MTPNLFAYLALGLWPIVSLWLFLTRQVNKAILWTLLSAQLLLPAGAAVKLEMIPQFDKNSISSICAIVGSVAVTRGSPRFLKTFGFIEVLIFAYIVSPFITSSMNGDAISIGATILPGVGAYDAFSTSIAQIIFFFPFLLGRRFFRSTPQNIDILRALVIVGLLYSLPMLFEMRMSPQLQTWIYGFRPGEFSQSVRGDGYRPMVFMGHGLIAAFFMMTTVVSACALWRTKIPVFRFRFPTRPLTIYLGGILVLCKSFGAVVYGAILAPLVSFGSPKLQARVAVLLVAIALAFPVLRTNNVFPTTVLVDVASKFSEERAASLQFRFNNEDRLLEHASERFWFGWGRFGRNRIYDEDGKDTNVTDGRWIITMGQFGLIGFLIEFLLLAVPVFRAASALRFASQMSDALLLGALSLIVAAGVVELLPNSTISPWSWLVCGALLGRAEFLSASTRRARMAPQPLMLRSASSIARKA